MTDLTNAEPSADEIAAAEAVIARKAAADKAKLQAAVPAIRAVLDDSAFAKVRSLAEEAREQLTPGTPFHQHLSAMLVGMVNLANDLPLIADA